MLNFDMVASPNAGWFVYDGDASDTASTGSTGSGVVEDVFVDFFESIGRETEATAFDGRSDYDAFVGPSSRLRAKPRLRARGRTRLSFLPAFVYCLLINGGPEELGRRGFALPRLQQRFSPGRTTFVLGAIWGLRHLPLLRVEENAGTTCPRSP
jgi:Type II CAAX prenyl endopeptidase Rce1-like